MDNPYKTLPDPRELDPEAYGIPVHIIKEFCPPEKVVKDMMKILEKELEKTYDKLGVRSRN